MTKKQKCFLLVIACILGAFIFFGISVPAQAMPKFYFEKDSNNSYNLADGSCYVTIQCDDYVNWDDVSVKWKIPSKYKSIIAFDNSEMSGDKQEMSFIGKKEGTAEVQCTITYKGEKKTIKRKIKFIADNVFKSIKLGSIDLTNKLKFRHDLQICSNTKKWKLSYKLNSGWKIKEMGYSRDFEEKSKSIANGKYLVGGTFENFLYIRAYNKKKKAEVEYEILINKYVTKTIQYGKPQKGTKITVTNSTRKGDPPDDMETETLVLKYGKGKLEQGEEADEVVYFNSKKDLFNKLKDHFYWGEVSMKKGNIVVKMIKTCQKSTNTIKVKNGHGMKVK